MFAMAAIAMIGLMGCESVNKDTPATTTTELWPAYSSSADLYGYINRKGEWVIPAQFTEASSFYSGGYAQVRINGEATFIDKNGKVQNCASFDSADPFCYGYALAQLNGKYGLLNTKFDYVIPPAYKRMSGMSSDGLVAYQAANDIYGYMDKNGNVLMKDDKPVFFDIADEFVDGYAVVCEDASRYTPSGLSRVPTYSLIDTKGNIVIQDGRYMYMKNLGQGVIAVVDYSLTAEYPYDWYLLSVKNMQALSFHKFNSVEPFSNDGYAVVGIAEQNDYRTTWRFGYINAQGEQVVSFNHDDAETSTEGYAWVYSNERWSLMEVQTGNRVLQLDYRTDNVSEDPLCGVHNGLTLVCKKTWYSNTDQSTTYRWIDVKNGNQVVFSWEIDRDKDRGSMKPSWAPAKNKKDAALSEFVVLK